MAIKFTINKRGELMNEFFKIFLKVVSIVIYFSLFVIDVILWSVLILWLLSLL